MVLLPQIFGPVGFFSSFFLSPEKLLLALGFLVPLILLYLIRPKPVNVSVPSLMFVFKDMGRSNVHRLFRSLFRDILLLIQLLAILLLGLSMAKPFINVNQDALVQQAIIVIDDSASTRAFSDDRFDEIRDRALERLSKENIVILAHTNPQLLDKNANPKLSASDAEDLIGDVEPTDMPGDLPTALDLAQQYVGPDTRVTIVSDFVLSRYENPELIEAKVKVLRSKGAIVELIPIVTSAKNVGIVDAQLSAQNATLELKVQNFNDKPAEIGLEFNGDAIELPKNLLGPRGQGDSLLSVSVPLGHGVSEFTLTPKDDFDPDNHYYVSIPDQEQVSVLMITNDPQVQQSRLVPALEAAGDQFTRVAVEYGIPPKVPDLEHNIYIIKDINTQFVLPGVIKDLHEQVENGAVLVVLAQPGLFSIDMSTLLPVEAKPEAPALGGKAEITVNSSLSLFRGLSDIGQADGSQLLRVKEVPGSVVYATVSTNDGPEPVIAARRIGKGAVIYYGIKDQRGFDIDPQSYAIIWGRIVDYSLTDPATLNIQTGAVLNSPTKISTPMGKLNGPVIASRSGLYQSGPLPLAANLYGLQSSRGGVATRDLNVQYESDIGSSANISDVSDAASAEGTNNDDNKVPKDLSTHAIIAGLALVLFELLFIKYRGDL